MTGKTTPGGNVRPQLLDEAALDGVAGGAPAGSTFGHFIAGDGQNLPYVGFLGWGGDKVELGRTNDLVNASFGNDTVHALGGNDTVIGGLGDDSLNGGTGNDVLDGAEGNDIVDGGDGNDQLSGGLGSDIMIGGSGGDTFFVSGNDTVYGGTDVGANGQPLATQSVDNIVITNATWDQVRVEFTSGGFDGAAKADGSRDLQQGSSGWIYFGDQKIQFHDVERITLQQDW